MGNIHQADLRRFGENQSMRGLLQILRISAILSGLQKSAPKTLRYFSHHGYRGTSLRSDKLSLREPDATLFRFLRALPEPRCRKLRPDSELPKFQEWR